MELQIEEIYDSYGIEEDLKGNFGNCGKIKARCQGKSTIASNLVIAKNNNKRLWRLLQAKSREESDLGFSVLYQSPKKSAKIQNHNNRAPEIGLDCSLTSSFAGKALFSRTFYKDKIEIEPKSASKIKSRLQTAKNRAVAYKNLYIQKEEDKINGRKLLLGETYHVLSPKNSLLLRNKKFRNRSKPRLGASSNRNEGAELDFYSRVTESNFGFSGNYSRTTTAKTKQHKRMKSNYCKVLLDKIVNCTKTFEDYENIRTFSIDNKQKVAIKANLKKKIPRYMHGTDSPDYTAINKLSNLVKTQRRNFTKKTGYRCSPFSQTMKTSLSNSNFAKGVSKQRLNQIMYPDKGES
ncbi:unnamed protein product [Moneuplotes crassus]|uniref:Uncharacterized protein n=1 Tax=Euplotes crassus TaxID=5936 RepID=A0AAD1UNG2_EUPCR|nr:unnamed protein product [Moneuplotes crassus]